METIDDVIEEFRVKRGAKSFRVTLGEDATPEGVRAELERLFAKEAEYYAIDEITRLKAHIQFLKDILMEISELGVVPFSQFLCEYHTETGHIRKEINRLTAIVPDRDIDYTLEYVKRDK